MPEVYKIALFRGDQQLNSSEYILASEYERLQKLYDEEVEAHRYTKCERDAAIAGVPVKRIQGNPYRVPKVGEFIEKWDGEL